MEKLVIRGIRELAAVLRCSTTTAQALVKRPDFPSARVGKNVVVPVEALHKWLAAGGTDQKAAV